MSNKDQLQIVLDENKKMSKEIVRLKGVEQVSAKYFDELQRLKKQEREAYKLRLEIAQCNAKYREMVEKHNDVVDKYNKLYRIMQVKERTLYNG